MSRGMATGNDERVSRGDRSYVQERHGCLVVQDAVPGGLPSGDLAEDTVIHLIDDPIHAEP
jgi:hypothetical protein